MVLDQEGKISEFNTAAQRIFPWLDAACVGKPVSNPNDASLFNVAKIRKLKRWSNCQTPGDITKVNLPRFTKGAQNWDGSMCLGIQPRATAYETSEKIREF
jgi:hypothetical protein